MRTSLFTSALALLAVPAVLAAPAAEVDLEKRQFLS